MKQCIVVVRAWPTPSPEPSHTLTPERLNVYRKASALAARDLNTEQVR